MQKSMEDTFCDDLALENGTTGTDASKVTLSNRLDFGSHGDDLFAKLRLYLRCTGAMASVASKPCSVSIDWLTSASEAMSNPVVKPLTPTALADANCVANTFVIADAVIPTGLKRYNQIRFTLAPYDAADTKVFPTTTPKFQAFITTDRVNPQ